MVMSVSKRWASLVPYAVFALIVLGVGIGTRLYVVRSSAQEPMLPLDLSGYRMTFNEDFHNLDVSAWGPGTRWIAHTPWNGDFGDARFADPVPGFPFTVNDGRLRIEARRGEDGKWSAGLLASTDPSGAGFSQQYGYFEMRAKFPPVVIGTTTGTFVIRLKGSGDTINTGRRLTSQISPRFIRAVRRRPACYRATLSPAWCVAL